MAVGCWIRLPIKERENISKTTFWNEERKILEYDGIDENIFIHKKIYIFDQTYIVIRIRWYDGVTVWVQPLDEYFKKNYVLSGEMTIAEAERILNELGYELVKANE
jgi:hypothetical protein